MHNILLIARREYLERVKTKGFLIATVLIPTLMGGGIFGAASLASNSKTSSHIAVLATTTQQQMASDLKADLENGKDTMMKVDVLPSITPHAVLDKQMADKQLDGYLAITPAPGMDVASTAARPAFDFTPRSSADIATSSAVKDSIQDSSYARIPGAAWYVCRTNLRTACARDAEYCGGERQSREFENFVLRRVYAVLPDVHGRADLWHERGAFDH